MGKQDNISQLREHGGIVACDHVSVEEHEAIDAVAKGLFGENYWKGPWPRDGRIPDSRLPEDLIPYGEALDLAEAASWSVEQAPGNVHPRRLFRRERERRRLMEERLRAFRERYGVGPGYDDVVRFLWDHASTEGFDRPSASDRIPVGLAERLYGMTKQGRREYMADASGIVQYRAWGCLRSDIECVRAYRRKYGNPGRPDDPEMKRINAAVRYCLVPEIRTYACSHDFASDGRREEYMARSMEAGSSSGTVEIVGTGGVDADMLHGRRLDLLGPSWERYVGRPGTRNRMVDAALVMDALVTGHVAELPDALRELVEGKRRRQ